MTASYRIRSAETWDSIRDAYLAGEAADSVCARFDVGLTAFRTRARDEGWRRADRPDPLPDALDFADEAIDDMTDAEIEAFCRLRMVAATRRGQVGEALRWSRLGEAATRRMAALARQVANDARTADLQDLDLFRRLAAAQSAQTAMRAAPVVPGEPHDPHDPHGVSEAADQTPAAPDPGAPAPNRADRRRSLKKTRKRR